MSYSPEPRRFDAVADTNGQDLRIVGLRVRDSGECRMCADASQARRKGMRSAKRRWRASRRRARFRFRRSRPGAAPSQAAARRPPSGLRDSTSSISLSACRTCVSSASLNRRRPTFTPAARAYSRWCIRAWQCLQSLADPCGDPLIVQSARIHESIFARGARRRAAHRGGRQCSRAPRRPPKGEPEAPGDFLERQAAAGAAIQQIIGRRRTCRFVCSKPNALWPRLRRRRES